MIDTAPGIADASGVSTADRNKHKKNHTDSRKLTGFCLQRMMDS
jgi:hypothetical protein